MVLKRTEGAQKVTTREKMTQASNSKNGEESEAAGDDCNAGWGLMRGGGATPRSGRVSVFALRIVPDEGPCL